MQVPPFTSLQVSFFPSLRVSFFLSLRTPFFPSLRVFSSLRGRSQKQSLTAPRHCEPKGWQVCWREAISSLHIPVGVKCSGEIASPDCYQARNDERGYSLAMMLWDYRLAMTQWGCSLAKAPLFVIARSEATKQSTPTLQFVIAILLFYTKKEKVIIQKQNIANFLAKVLNFVI